MVGAATLGLVALLAWALGRELPLLLGDSGPSRIVLIVIDALRADHLPIYGYPYDTSPFLSELAARGVVFERAYSTATTTAPATASLFTSRYPIQHGARRSPRRR